MRFIPPATVAPGARQGPLAGPASSIRRGIDQIQPVIRNDAIYEKPAALTLETALGAGDDGQYDRLAGQGERDVARGVLQNEGVGDSVVEVPGFGAQVDPDRPGLGVRVVVQECRPGRSVEVIRRQAVEFQDARNIGRLDNAAEDAHISRAVQTEVRLSPAAALGVPRRKGRFVAGRDDPDDRG